MASINSLVPLVALDVANVPQMIVVKMLRLAAQEFCRESDYWEETITVTLSGQARYALTYPANVKPCRIVAVTLDDKPLTPGADYEEVGRGTIAVFRDPGYGELVVKVSVQPDDTCTELNDDLVDYYQQGLVAGAVTRLLRMPDKPWTNYRGVKLHKDLFMFQYRAARRERLSQNARFNKKPVKYQFF